MRASFFLGAAYIHSVFIAHNHERKRGFLCVHTSNTHLLCVVYFVWPTIFHTRDSQFVTRVTRTRALRLSRLSCLAQMLSICTQCIFTIGMCVVLPTAAKTNARRWLFLRTAPTRMRSRAFFIHLAMDVTGVCDCVNCSYGRGIVAMFCLRPKYTQHFGTHAHNSGDSDTRMCRRRVRDLQIACIFYRPPGLTPSYQCRALRIICIIRIRSEMKDELID